jgi:hypothetical protein
MRAQVQGTVYLLHFTEPYRHARHYMGWTENLPARLALHTEGRGARLVEVVIGHGIGFRPRPDLERGSVPGAGAQAPPHGPALLPDLPPAAAPPRLSRPAVGEGSRSAPSFPQRLASSPVLAARQAAGIPTLAHHGGPGGDRRPRLRRGLAGPCTPRPARRSVPAGRVPPRTLRGQGSLRAHECSLGPAGRPLTAPGPGRPGANVSPGWG